MYENVLHFLHNFNHTKNESEHNIKSLFKFALEKHCKESAKNCKSL